MRTALIIASVIVLLSSGVAWPDDLPSISSSVHHTDTETCATCHLLPETDLKSWWTFSWNKRKLKGEGPAGVCAECHEQSSFGHGIGKRPEMNRADLPLDKEGRVTCAITCHAFHRKGGEALDQYHLRMPASDLCLSCHEK